MENLNKENFFDVAAEKFPKAFDNFSKFIDAYKASVNWNELFGTIPANKPGIVDGIVIDVELARKSLGWFDEKCPHINLKTAQFTDNVKFHDIPFELQVGIIAKWFTTLRYVGRNYFEPQWLFQYGVFPSIYVMDNVFAKLEEILNDPNHKLKSDMHDLQEQDLKNIKDKGQSNNQ